MPAGPDFAHESVLVGEVLEYLSPREDEVYVDCTVGGGGHSAAIPGRIIGIDRDPAALAAAAARLGARATLVHAEFGDIARILPELGIEKVNGFIADLGVSSPQLDWAERGFSFTREGPLDMRMDPTRGPTALDLLKATDADDLANIISELGEERHARRIARLIKEAIREDKIHTTTDLAGVVAKGIPIVEQRKSKIHPATRTFQALRIAVNAELDQLERFLAAFPDLLAPGGRCVIISFHSLEDRLVKNCFRDLAWTTSLPPKLAREAGERIEPVVELLTKKAVFATDDEVERNPRARSARLRACRRTSAPNLPMGGSPGDRRMRGRD
ncbi:MAG TPA: 16S rRNA (cytosine(1402)-N(4))-methyltransferase RsmH [Kofleriaceae bacterium]|nr:16S rRNA (cytosine(1402)-N(4))-methyltransferase RsmH [Kofleriaceae bacterium]